MKLMQSLSESQLLTSTTSYRRYSARQLAELVYLHVIAIRILAAEPLGKSFATDYAHRTVAYMGFSKWYQNATDLHLLIHGLLDEEIALKLPDASQEFRETLYFDEGEIRFWLKDIANHHVNEPRTRKLFMHLDGQFQIKDGSMKAIRRLVQDWPRNTARQKQLSMTRLLQMMRVRARRSDLLVRLEKLATEMKLELHNVNNPETGDVASHDGSDPHHVKKKTSFLGTIAAVAGGAMLGYHAVKHLSEGETVIVKNPTVEQFFGMKSSAEHGDGIKGCILGGSLYVWDGSHIDQVDARRILDDKDPIVEMSLWEGYIELEVDDERTEEVLEAMQSCPALNDLYDGEPVVNLVNSATYYEEVETMLSEDDGGSICSGDFAPVVKVLGAVQRRNKRHKKKK